MDEPTSGLDPINKLKIWSILHELRGSRTFLITTHSMSEAEELCDSIGILRQGQLVRLGSPMQIKSEFGSGWNIDAYFHDMSEGGDRKIQNFISFVDNANKNFSVKAHHDNCLKIYFDCSDQEMLEFCRSLEERREQLEIQTWSIYKTSLQDSVVEIFKQD